MANTPFILIAEDEPAHAEAIRRAFNEAGATAEIQVVGTLREYRQAVAARPPDIALMDVNLPDNRTMETLTSPPEARAFPVLVMTSHGNEQMAVEAIKGGAIDYISKSPQAFADMPRVVRRALDQWETLLLGKRAEKALDASEIRYRRLHESMRDAFVNVDMAGRILEFNEAYRIMLGYEGEELRAIAHVDLVPEKWHALEAEIVDTQILARGYSDVYEKEYRRKDGTTLPVELRTNLLRDEEGKPVGMWAIVRDITERKQIESRLAHLASHDPLTGLSNRPLFKECLVRSVAKANRGRPSSLMVFDVDHFKAVNDTLGHAAGDDVLIELAQLVQQRLRTEDILARIGGDEFAVLLEDTSVGQARVVAERACRAISNHAFLVDRRIQPTLSIGMVEVTGRDEVDALLSRADAAMYKAKEQGGNRLVCERPVVAT
ncbi:MAG: diguanylate cyclase [Phycisphaerae bacterium]|jgi:diguanylate cyclase (GGDEF)-like protein/PAS domain S-box-containing protein